jgi:hypothetical protein
MALKAILTKSEYEALAEPIRKEYAEKDGKFVLALEGMPDPLEQQELKTKLAEFRDNNRRMYTEIEGLKTRYEGVDPEEYKTLKNEVEVLKKKGINKPDDIAAIVDAAVVKATKPLADKLAAEEKARAEAQEKIRNTEFERLVTEVAVKAGVRQSAVPLLVPKAKEKFELKDDAIVPKDGVKHPTEPHKDYTPSEWIQELAKTDDYLFAPSEGGGASGNRTKKSSGGRLLINPTAEEMGRNMDAIAKGEVQVVRQ